MLEDVTMSVLFNASRVYHSVLKGCVSACVFECIIACCKGVSMIPSDASEGQ